VIAVGLFLAIASTVAINGGYAWQHDAASMLPPLTLRRPIRSLLSLFRNGRWFAGFAAGIGGWVLYVVALRIAPLSLVQAAAAGGIAVLAVGGGRLLTHERLGVVLALAGLALLGLSLGSHTVSSHGSPLAVALWLGGSVVAAAVVAAVLRGGVGLGTAAGILYAAGDVGTKIAVVGGTRLWFVPALLACHGLAFVAFQLGLQRGRRLATAGVAVLWTNALPIVAGMALFAESSGGALRLLAFALVLVAAVALARATAEAEPARA
jgi:hypothetical protein